MKEAPEGKLIFTLQKKYLWIWINKENTKKLKYNGDMVTGWDEKYNCQFLDSDGKEVSLHDMNCRYVITGVKGEI